MRTCIKCEKTKPIEDFATVTMSRKNKRGIVNDYSYHRHWCKECWLKRATEYWHANYGRNKKQSNLQPGEETECLKK